MTRLLSDLLPALAGAGSELLNRLTGLALSLGAEHVAACMRAGGCW